MPHTPRVLIDGYFLDRAYGFGRYVRELLNVIDAWLPDIYPILLVPAGAEPRAGSLLRTQVVVREQRPFPIWEQLIVPAVARKYACDLVHFPYQSTALAWPRASTVATIHDLMFLRPAATAGTLTNRLAHTYRRTLFHLHTRHARQIIAVSEATQRELSSCAQVSSTVVPNSCELFVTSQKDVAPEAKLGRFFLHRGDRGPHKNTRRIIEAFGVLREAHPDTRLLVYGARPADGLLDGLRAEGVSMLGKVSDARLAALYKAAVAVVTVSIEEGFGLSITEALGFGAPVITSNISPMSDIAGDAALLVDPLRVDEITQAMRRILTEPGLAEHQRLRGRARYERFSAARVAAELRSVYKPGSRPR